MCFVFIWEQTAIISLYSINWLVFITEIKSVYSAVRTGSLNKAFCASSLNGYERRSNTRSVPSLPALRSLVRAPFPSLAHAPISSCRPSAYLSFCLHDERHFVRFYIEQVHWNLWLKSDMNTFTWDPSAHSPSLMFVAATNISLKWCIENSTFYFRHTYFLYGLQASRELKKG
jgi:hypothetical protein